jgi:hypothetical protein
MDKGQYRKRSVVVGNTRGDAMVENERSEGILRKKLPRRKLLQSALAGAAAGLIACDLKEDAPTLKQDAGPKIQASSTPSLGRSAQGPNAIVIVLDSLRADHLGCYGNDWIKTPNIDALARDSTVFTHAFPQAMPTIPNRAVHHTGQNVWPYRQWVTRVGANNPWALLGPCLEKASRCRRPSSKTTSRRVL